MPTIDNYKPLAMSKNIQTRHWNSVERLRPLMPAQSYISLTPAKQMAVFRAPLSGIDAIIAQSNDFIQNMPNANMMRDSVKSPVKLTPIKAPRNDVFETGYNRKRNVQKYFKQQVESL